MDFVDVQGLFHCDWKYDQTAIDLNWTVKIVDLDSLQYSLYDKKKKMRMPYHSDTSYRAPTQCRQCYETFELPRTNRPA